MIEQLKTIRKALILGIKAINHLGGAREAMPLHDAMPAIAQLEAMAGQEPVAWAMPKGDGTFIDVITPAEHAREEGSYTVPLFAHPAAQQPQKLEDVEQYRMQMAGISTAAVGYWKEGDSIHPDYDTPALRDVAKLYAKYDALYKAQQPDRITPAELAKRIERGEKWEVAQQPQAEAVPLQVRYHSMPESCGRTNWTASLFVKGRGDFTIARSEYPHRVRYDADCVRWLIGELDEKPFILDYDGDEATPCHLCGGTGEVDGKPCHGLNFKGTVHHAAPQQAEAVPDVVRDAERYRWLRDKSVPPHNFYISVPDEFHGVHYQPSEVDAYIDAAIEAAIAQQKGGV